MWKGVEVPQLLEVQAATSRLQGARAELEQSAALLQIDAPTAAAAVVLAGSLEKFQARTVRDAGRWLVLARPVPAGSGSHGSVSKALTIIREWMLECGVPATTITYDGQSHLLRRQDATPPPAPRPDAA